MTLFFLLLILFIFVVVRPLYKVATFYRRLKKSFFNQASNERHNHSKNNSTGQPNERKIFDKSVGEYTQFEEISVSSSTYTETLPDDGKVLKVESQTIDVEWEDL